MDELALLLTPGRLSTKTRAAIIAAYNTALAESGSPGLADTQSTRNWADTAFFTAGESGAKFTAQQLLASSPEFAATNIHTPQPGLKRKPSREPSDGVKSGRPYKAVVMVWLAGGADSFNMLMPHDGCTASTTSPDKSIADQYDEVGVGIQLISDTSKYRYHLVYRFRPGS